MTGPDFTFVQGDSGPTVTDTLTFSDGSIPNLTGATLQFQLRSLTQPAPLTTGSTLTGTATITNLQTGGVQYTPTVADTSNPAGAYQAKWIVTYQSGQTQTFPTVGYLWGVIEPNLTSEPQALVGLPDVKDYLNSFGLGPDRAHDSKLLHYIYAATPIIEGITGPIIVRTFDEWHQGGQFFIRLKRRPSYALGTTPILNVMACDEYRGPVKYTLQVIGEPTQASIYSVMLDPKPGILYRRTAGGGVLPFGAGPFGGAMPDAVHVTYQAGLASVPENIRLATLEAIREHYQNTLPTGMGSRAMTDEFDRSTGQSFSQILGRYVRSELGPMRRHPAIA